MCLSFPGLVIWPGQTRAKAGAQEEITFQTSVHLTSAYILTKASHMAKPKLNGVGAHSSHGGELEGREWLLLTPYNLMN